MLGVEGNSFLPYDQHDRSNFPRQGQASHLRSHTFGNQGRVELLERTRFDRSDGGGTLKQVLQIVIAVSVESANRYLLLGFLELSFHRTVIGTAMRFDGKTAVFPERSFGAESVWCLDQCDQQRCP